MRTMRILFAFLLIGLASAASIQKSDDNDYMPPDWVEDDNDNGGFDDWTNVGPDHHNEAGEDDIKTDLGKALKDGLDKVLEKIKEAINEGKDVKQELVEKVKALVEKLRKIKADAGQSTKEFMKEVKEKARDYIKKLLEKYGLGKRSADDRVAELQAELNYKDMLRKLKEHLKKTVDPELLKEKIEKIFDQGSEILKRLLQTFKEKGRRKLEILIDALLDEDDEDERETRGIKDYWEKVKDYFKDLKIDLQEKYMKFGEWVKEALGKGMEHSKDKYDNIKAIAREFARHVKGVSKEVSNEAKEFFRQYKEELGDVWEELKEAWKTRKED